MGIRQTINPHPIWKNTLGKQKDWQSCIKASPRLFCSRAYRSLCNIKFVFVNALLQYYIVLPGHYLFNGPFWEGTVLQFMTECGGTTTAGGKEFARISSPSVSDFWEIFIPLKVEEPPVVPFYLLKVNYQGHPNGSVERVTQEQEHSCSLQPVGLGTGVRGWGMNYAFLQLSGWRSSNSPALNA